MKIFCFGLILLVLLSAMTGRLTKADKHWFLDALKGVGKQLLPVVGNLASQGVAKGAEWLSGKLGKRRLK